MDIAIFTLTSALHDEQAVGATTASFLAALRIPHKLCGADYGEYGSHDLNLIFVRTGGTEGIFRDLLPQLRQQSSQPIYLLTNGSSNSLAASMEILSYLRQRDIAGEILHGSNAYVTGRITELAGTGAARRKLRGQRLGIIGAPSDWLISSLVDRNEVRNKLGIDLIDINMDEVIAMYNATPTPTTVNIDAPVPNDEIRMALPGAERIYLALKQIVEQYKLNGLTIRCFDLLTAVRNTGCLALARLNSEGIIAGCEGDMPAMLSMAIAQAVTGCTGFQSNPARINPETGEILMAHCTIPFNMVDRYELDTHFESGIGVGIRGFRRSGPVTLFKVSGNLQRCFAAQGSLEQCGCETDLCRTQISIRLYDRQQARYFLTDPIGNHHIVVPGHVANTLRAVIS